MKLSSKLIISAGLLTLAVSKGYDIVETLNIKDVVLPEGFTVTAHTGCERTKANSLDSITLGFGYGADIVEFDLNFNSDGLAVLSHNEPKGECVTLDEAFMLISGYKALKVNVDVKSIADLGQVVASAQKYALTDRIFFTGIEREKVQIIKKTAPGYVYYLNTDIDASKKNDAEYIASLADEVRQLGACGININFRNVTDEIVKIFHANNLLVSVWTVNRIADMKKMLKLGVDNITTKKIENLRNILDFIRK